MKNIVFFLFLFTCKFCVGQVVRFQLYTTAPCSIIEHLDTAYSLYKITNTGITDYFAKKGIVNLTDTGKYGINLEDGPYIDTLIEISDTGLFVFKYKEPKIGLYNGGIDAPPLYKSCGRLINGYDDDFFPNGNIRIRGTFVNGRIKDSICTFYFNGRIKKRIIHLPKESVIEEYDSLNNLIKISHNSARSM